MFFSFVRESGWKKAAGSALPVFLCASSAAVMWCAGSPQLGDRPRSASADEPKPVMPLGDAIGQIDGDAIAVSGPMSVEAVHGEVKTILRSGADIRVKSGMAHITLTEGGQIAICGPAHFSMLKSGSALTLALDTGIVHVHIEREPALTVYTPQIKAQPIAIGDGPQDVLVGFDVNGVMCVRANRGAVRIVQQLTEQTLLVPQGGDVTLNSGQLETLRTVAGHCACEAAITAPPSTEVSRMASAAEVKEKPPAPAPAKPKAVEAPEKAAAEKAAPREEPVYQVFVPPLVFDANAKVQPEPDARMIVLVRRVRVRPTLIFQGRVEGDTVASVSQPPAAAAAVVAQPAKSTPAPAATLAERVRNAWHSLWPSKP